MANRIPYGYEINKGKICINEIEASEIIEIFNTYIKCNSYVEASKILGGKVNSQRVRYILQKSLYMGNEKYPSIISEDKFNEVQNLILKKALQVGKVYKPKPPKEIKVTSTFSIGRVPVKYDDPYQQAEFAYSQIEENKNEQ